MTVRSILTIVFATTIIGSSCGRPKESKDSEEEHPAPVQIAKVVRKPIRHIVTAEAILYAQAQSSVTSKISAPVRRIYVNRGEHVRAGQPLIELEDRDLAAAVKEARALYDQARAQQLNTVRGTLPEDATRARTDLATAQEALDAAKKLRDNRVTLVREGALAQKLADDAEVALVQAQSQLENARRHLESLNDVSREQQVKAAQSQTEAAQARLQNAEAQLGYALIRSPIAGVVAERPINVGEMASSGGALLTVVDISEVVARALVPAGELTYVRLNDSAQIEVPGKTATGKVTVISPAVDPASTVVEVWIRAPNPKGTLKPGATAHVSIQGAEDPKALVIPASAVLASETGTNIVMVVGPQSIAHQRAVTLGVREAGETEVTSGINEGDVVVTQGGNGLADNAKVQVVKGGTQQGEAGSGDKDE